MRARGTPPRGAPSGPHTHAKFPAAQELKPKPIPDCLNTLPQTSKEAVRGERPRLWKYAKPIDYFHLILVSLQQPTVENFTALRLADALRLLPSPIRGYLLIKVSGVRFSAGAPKIEAPFKVLLFFILLRSRTSFAFPLQPSYPYLFAPYLS